MSNTFVFMGCIEWELCIKRKGSEGSEGKVDGDFGPEGYGRLSAAGCVEGGDSGLWPLRVVVAAVAAVYSPFP